MGPGAGGERLELRLLASGATQHVFLRADQPEDGWVYKLPAIVDALLPSRPSIGRIAPASGGRRLAYSLLYATPRDLWGRIDTLRRLPMAERAAGGYVGLADGLLSLHLRRSRIAAFRRVLRIHRLLGDQGAEEAGLLPWRELRGVRATLHAGELRRQYRGPVLAQRRADVFFERSEGLERFDGRELVRIQHRLWRRGVALADGAGALGPQGWALLGGRVLLADTGCLTDDFRQARGVLAPGLMEMLQARQLRRQPDPAALARARAYYEMVRSQINPDRLAELWCKEPRAR